MRMGYEMSLKQVQKLVITPELRQAITVLQLPWMELREYIETEMLENPVLELADATGPETASGDDGGIEAADARSDETLSRDVNERQRGEASDGSQDDRGDAVTDGPDVDWQAYFDDASDLGYVMPRERNEEAESSYESYVGHQESFQEHLMFQLRLSPLSDDDMRIGSIIIGGIDDDGYLRMEVSEIAAMAGVSVERVERVLSVVQGFEPSGVGARNLRECLLIQLGTIDVPADERDLASTLIKDYLDDVAAGRLAKIAQRLQRPVAAVQRACDVIKTLDPKPGREFSGTRPAGYIVPDVTVERVGDDYVIVVNDVSAPRLTINPAYREMLRNPQQEAGAVEFVKSKLGSAMWLIRSIEQRRRTLYRVTECIVRFQRDFFDKGIKHLKPLTLKEVADEIGVHESTVSRATAGKYVQTPRGVYEMRFFFASGVPTATGDSASSESIKRMIRDIIESEDPKEPLSDQAIADLLRAQGILISRRTVAKYREEDMIPASKQRKRF
ncbi:MAG: RNA polymerase factor sigma-54 [Firmicutes bacterium]|jgi:RNA polymerase sigma-54 factor|nr:RNA polymerase factor sigma-54 [Bacillota bacterium]MDH7494443.1 RNA polymerase factor sigma-54 [Bacillota bacterium]